MDIKNAKTTDLIAAVNAVSTRQVKKFRDRATAEQRAEQSLVGETKATLKKIPLDVRKALKIKISDPTGNPPGPRSSMRTTKVFRLVSENPRKKGTHGYTSFALIPEEGITFAEYKKAGGRNQDLKWDISHKFVELRHE